MRSPRAAGKNQPGCGEKKSDRVFPCLSFVLYSPTHDLSYSLAIELSHTYLAVEEMSIANERDRRLKTFSIDIIGLDTLCFVKQMVSCMVGAYLPVFLKLGLPRLYFKEV
jgi:hypothetical protein